jgi:hypothetical protein
MQGVTGLRAATLMDLSGDGPQNGIEKAGP